MPLFLTFISRQSSRMPSIVGCLFVLLSGYFLLGERLSIGHHHMIKNNVVRPGEEIDNTLPKTVRLPPDSRFIEGAHKTKNNVETGALQTVHWATDRSPNAQLLKSPPRHHAVNMTTQPSGIKLEKSAQKPHLYIYPMGRIGNCLFTIAAAYSLAHQYNHQLVLDNGYKYLSHSFPGLNDIPFVRIGKKLNVTHMGEPGFAKYSFQMYQSLANFGDVLLVGYLQSFKYFSDYEQDIRKLFRFSDTLLYKASQTLADIRTSYIKKHGPVSSLTFVGLHIRKGDMSSSGKAAIGYHTVDSDYIYKSMFYFQRKYKNVAFVLRTDTPNWSKDNLFMEAVYQPPSLSAEKDLALLSLCNHTITSTGTFSWWAGWLAGGEVAYFHNPYNMSSSMAKGFVAEDFFPSHWLPVSKMSRQDIERLPESSS